MILRTRIMALIPHQGASCLLDEWLACTETGIRCRTRTHLDPANPLRRMGAAPGEGLPALHGAEYGMQAAALHGALRGSDPQAGPPGGLLVGLRGLAFATDFLDDPAHGALIVIAERISAGPAGLVYGFELLTESGVWLVRGQGSVARPARDKTEHCDTERGNRGGVFPA